MSQAATTAGASEITLREPGNDDVQECARICYEAFGQIDEYHRFPRDFPTVEFADGDRRLGPAPERVGRAC